MTIIREIRNMVAVSGAAAYRKALVLIGADQATAELQLADIADIAQFPIFNLAAGSQALTLAMMRSGTLVSTSAGSTVLSIPKFSDIADRGTATAGGATDFSFTVQRRGLGGLFVNPATGVTITWNDLDPQYLSQNHPRVMLSYTSDTTLIAE